MTDTMEEKDLLHTQQDNSHKKATRSGNEHVELRDLVSFDIHEEHNDG